MEVAQPPPQGIEGKVNLHDYIPILADIEDFVNVGDLIRVQENKGVLNLTYFILL